MVMFEHGSLREVVDHETESCGCPVEAKVDEANPFPVAQAAGLAPLAKAPANATVVGQENAQLTATLRHDAAPEAAAPAAVPVVAVEKKPGAMARFGHWLRRIFGGK